MANMSDGTMATQFDPIPVRTRKSLSTGSTLLNLALTGEPFGGFLRGHYFFIVGDSTSGKTFLSMTCLAEATLNKGFRNYRFIYDNIENGMLLDLDTLFSEEVADRVEPPAVTKDGEPLFSGTIEEFYYHLDDALCWDKDRQTAAGKPFIYVLDSMDGLDSEAADKKFQQHKTAHRKRQGTVAASDANGEATERVAGSYGDGKAKKNSEGLRKAMKGLRQTGSILIIISQTRDDISSMFHGAKTRSGGRALRFYATNEIWSSVATVLKKKVHDKDRKVGVRVKLDVKKNRITGKLADVEVDIFPNYGIDDLGSCVDYLVEEGFWPVEKQTITCKGLPDGVCGTREKVIRLVEKRGLEDDVRQLCGECWKEVDQACALRRKNRYSQGKE